MKTIEIKGYLIGYVFGYDHSDPHKISWSFHCYYDPKTADDRQVVCIPHTLVVDVPEINVVAAQVAACEAAKVAALEAYQATVAQINERLSKLLAITNEATEGQP